jgi:hypothetical protein
VKAKPESKDLRVGMIAEPTDRRSFDYASRDKAARSSAQDDTFVLHCDTFHIQIHYIDVSLGQLQSAR